MKIKLGISILNLCILALFSSRAYANQLGNVIFNIGNTTDNIDYTETTLEWDWNKRDLLWPYRNENQNPLNFGLSYYNRYQEGPLFKFNYHEFLGHFDFQFNEKHKIESEYGLFHIDEDGHSDQTTKLKTHIKLISQFNKNLNTQLEVGRGLALRQIFLLRGSLLNLTATHIGARAQYQFLNQWLVTNIVAQKSYMINDNTRNYYDAELMVAMMTWPHWIRMGWGYHEMNYDKNSPSYWSPTDFYAHGPRLDLSFSLIEPLQYYLGGSYNWFEEDKRYQGSGYYMRTGLRYGVREDYTLDIGYERNESIQNSNSWVSQAYALNLNCFF